jgi:hypothetical protein
MLCDIRKHTHSYATCQQDGKINAGKDTKENRQGRQGGVRRHDVRPLRYACPGSDRQSREGRQAANVNPDPNGHGGLAEGEGIPEMRGPARFKQSDIARALRAAKQAGAPVEVEIALDGTIRLIPIEIKEPKSWKPYGHREAVL